MSRVFSNFFEKVLASGLQRTHRRPHYGQHLYSLDIVIVPHLVGFVNPFFKTFLSFLGAVGGDISPPVQRLPSSNQCHPSWVDGSWLPLALSIILGFWKKSTLFFVKFLTISPREKIIASSPELRAGVSKILVEHQGLHSVYEKYSAYC